MQPLALAVREPADGEQVGRVEQPHAIRQVEPDTRVELLGDVSKACGAEAGQHAWDMSSTGGALAAPDPGSGVYCETPKI